MEDAKSQLVDKLKTANNILVTVSRNPSVDQLSALLGLTLALNKQGKHAAAVFSGDVPSTLEFLQPEETFEKNTDSLRDFIVALDKNKADKLRYKVEDNVVRIFITPYKTSISQDDFEFSQGDFNVDLVLAIGVQQQEDLDEAITAHGRILHDATVASVNTSGEGGLGAINWHDAGASSLSELATELVQSLDEKILDEQIATALLTGIVAETDRFRNEKTSAETMSASAALMSAGANQQLVAEKLEAPLEVHAEEQDDQGEQPQNEDGAIDIEHSSDESGPAIELPTPDESSNSEDQPEQETEPQEPTEEATESVSEGPKLVTEPPSLGGTLTANSTEEKLDPVTDPLSLPQEEEPQLLDHREQVLNVDPLQPEPAMTPPPAAWQPPADPVPQPVPSGPLSFNPTLSDDPSAGVAPAQPADDDKTLSEIEQAVDSPHIAAADLGSARDEVNRALTDATAPVPPPQPIQALNAQPFGGDLRQDTVPSVQDPAPAPQVIDPNAPPPVPPPIPFQFGNPPQQQ